MGAAAATLTPVTLELGGKDAFIVCDDADLGQARARAALPWHRTPAATAAPHCKQAHRMLPCESQALRRRRPPHGTAAC